MKLAKKDAFMTSAFNNGFKQWDLVGEIILLAKETSHATRRILPRAYQAQLSDRLFTPQTLSSQRRDWICCRSSCYYGLRPKALRSAYSGSTDLSLGFIAEFNFLRMSLSSKFLRSLWGVLEESMRSSWGVPDDSPKTPWVVWGVLEESSRTSWGVSGDF